ncbi:hypothetical protein FUAX_27710 [Fulvitalea axinellae]|uniref:Por secretion system C-terminal sorting domain-containing protein n=1 Tax=Fulvitalea axinellae TaxID=1182444 RepID=A0AAU9D741_9BACT|nr:hypothetical protein FUAX_27710 [Fulvitalea axinellae]
MKNHAYSLSLFLLLSLFSVNAIFAQSQPKTEIKIKSITRDADGNEKVTERIYHSMEDYKADTSEFKRKHSNFATINIDSAGTNQFFGNGDFQKDIFEKVESMSRNFNGDFDELFKHFGKNNLNVKPRPNNNFFSSPITTALKPIDNKAASKIFPEASPYHKEFSFKSISTSLANDNLILRFATGTGDLKVSLTDKNGDYIFLDHRADFEGEYMQNINLRNAKPAEYLLQISQGKRSWSQILKLEKAE